MPGDVSVVAIARDAIAQQVVPPLTCVAVPADEMGRQAIDLLSSWDGSPVAPALAPDGAARRERLTPAEP